MHAATPRRLATCASGLPMERLARAAMPFIVLQSGVLFVCILFPSVVATLPRWLGH